jgi:hypothetical protein
MLNFLVESMICDCVGTLVLAMLTDPQGRMFLSLVAAVLSFMLLLGVTIRGIGWLCKWRS